MAKKTAFLFFLFLFFASQTLIAGNNLEMDFALPLSSYWPFSQAQIIHDAGDFIYLGSGNQVLFFEISSDNSYIYAGNYTLPADISSIETSPNQLFIGTFGEGLFVFPPGKNDPDPLMHWTEAKKIWHISAADDQLFVSAGLDGLFILDKENLEKEIFIQAQGAIWKTIIRENIIYLIDGLATTNLFVIDLKETEQKMEIVILDLDEEGEPQDEIILPEEIEEMEEDQITPEQRHLATINRGNHIKDLALSGNILYVADGEGGLVLYDISNPVRINFLKAIPPEEFGDEFIHTVRSEESRIIATGKNGLYFLQNSEIKEKVSIETPFTNRLGPEPDFLDATGGKAIVISLFNGVLLLDIEQIPGVKRLGHLEYPQRLEALSIKEERAFFASGIERLWELRIEEQNPNTSGLLNWIEIPGIGQEIFGFENNLFIASGIGLVTVNKNEPGGMEFAGFLPFPYPDNQPDYKKGWTQDIVLFRNLAFVAAGGGGVWIVDCIEPSSPVNLLLFSHGETVNHVHIDPENSLLFTAGEPYLGIFDISEPHSPKKIKEIELTHPPSDINHFNNHLYLSQKLPSGEKGRLKIFDYSNPESIEQKRNLNFEHRGPNSIVIKENRLLALSAEQGVEFFSLFSPANPVPEFKLEIEGSTIMDVYPPHLGLASQEKGLFLFEYQNPTY